MGRAETMEVAEEKAKKSAIQNATGLAGALVKNYTKVKNLTLERDVIEEDNELYLSPTPLRCKYSTTYLNLINLSQHRRAI